MIKIENKYFKIVDCILVILLSITIIGSIFFLHIVVPTGSMEHTIEKGDHFLVLKSCWIKEYSREDILVFRKAGEKHLLVKRLIGMPGDNVRIVDGILYINGKKFDEEYVSNNDYDINMEFDVPEGSYLFLGDNRSNSFDARFWDMPYVPESNIVGRLYFGPFRFK